MKITDMTEKELRKLLQKYNEGNCSAREIDAINLWIDSIGESSEFMLHDEEYEKYIQLIREKIKENTGLLVAYRAPLRNKLLKRNLKWSIAAILLIMFGCGLYMVINKNNSSNKITQTNIKDIAPGGNHAYLTLANGTKVSLDSIHNGKVFTDNNGIVSKPQNGQLAYQMNNGITSDTTIYYNTLTTPKGGQYQLTLSDGTLVKLNAASSIRYPICFAGNNRKVYITGEAYFQVKHNDNKPFIVIASHTVIQDVGTVFNVNAYEDEKFIKTTLSEGAIKVANKTLKPGEQAITDSISEDITIAKVDLDNILAWTKGFLSANDIDLEELMKQLARWYDVDIQYQGEIPSVKVGGIIGRNVNLSNILNVLSANGIHARLENKTIIITQ